MGEARPAKKGETLEVRLPHATKTAFMMHCRDEGRTASETVRRLIEGELTGPPPPRGRLRWAQVLAAALAGLVVGGVAAPSLAHSASTCGPGVRVVGPGPGR